MLSDRAVYCPFGPIQKLEDHHVSRSRGRHVARIPERWVRAESERVAFTGPAGADVPAGLLASTW